MNIANYGLREKYEEFRKFGKRLSEVKNIIDWEGLRPLMKDLFTDDTDKGGRPNFDEILMVKILLLQSV